jgi:hypothetical protein
MRLKRKKLCLYAAAGVLAYFLYMTCLPIHLDILTLARKTGTHSTVLTTELTHNLLLVFWIRGILLRVRIPGSVPLTNGSGSGSGSYYFRPWPSRRQKTKKANVFYVYTIFHKVTKSQNSRNQCFSYFFCLIIEGSGFVLLSIRIRIQIRIPNTAFTVIY